MAVGFRLGSILSLVLLLVVLMSFGGGAAQAQGPNLIQNPGFERPYVDYPGKENCRIAAGWTAYWFEGSREEVSQGYRFAPEYKAAFREDFPGNRVRNGELSQQWFHSWGNFQGGVLQQVGNIPVGSRLRFEIWGMSWSCDRENKGNCANATSGDPSPMRFKIGIDALGGTDALNPRIVWSPEQNAYDNWTLFRVEAAAQNSTITVFIYAYPEYRSQDNNVYVDDASLVVLGPPPTNTPLPTRPPTATPIPSATPIPTQTPLPSATPPPTSTNTAVPSSTPTWTATATIAATATAVPPTATTAPTATPTAVPAATATVTSAGTSSVATSQRTAAPSWLLYGLYGLVVIVILTVAALALRLRGK